MTQILTQIMVLSRQKICADCLEMLDWYFLHVLHPYIIIPCKYTFPIYVELLTRLMYCILAFLTIISLRLISYKWYFRPLKYIYLFALKIDKEKNDSKDTFVTSKHSCNLLGFFKDVLLSTSFYSSLLARMVTV